jgi:hypothetical protein
MYLLNIQNYNPDEVIWDAYDWSDMNDDNSLNDPITLNTENSNGE